MFLAVGCRGQCSVTGGVGWGMDCGEVVAHNSSIATGGIFEEIDPSHFLSRERERLKIEFMGLSPSLTHTRTHKGIHMVPATRGSLVLCYQWALLWKRGPLAIVRWRMWTGKNHISAIITSTSFFCCIFLVKHCIVSGLLARSCQILTPLHESIHGTSQRDRH